MDVREAVHEFLHAKHTYLELFLLILTTMHPYCPLTRVRSNQHILWNKADVPGRGFYFFEIKKGFRMSVATLVLAAALNPGGLIAWIIIGLLAGWLAGVIMPGRGFGFLGDLIVGLVGAFIGGLIVNLLVPDATFGFWGSLLVALVGACILVGILHAIGRGRTTPNRNAPL